MTKYLEKSDLGIKFKNENIEEANIKRFVFLCSSLSFYKHLKEDEILFNEGDVGDKFYIILDGSVAVVKALEKDYFWTAEEYLKYLIELKKRNDPYLLKKTVKANGIAFPLEMKNLDEIKDILFGVRVSIAMKRNSTIEDIKQLLDTNEDYKLNLNLEKNHSPEMLKAKLQKISANNLKGVLSENDLAKYINTSNNERIKVKIYEYFEIVKLHKGKYFGDVALEKKNNLR